MELTGQRTEVRLVSAVLQVAGDLRLLGFCSAAAHRVPRTLAGAPWLPDYISFFVGTTLPAGWVFPHTRTASRSPSSPARVLADQADGAAVGPAARRTPRRRPRRGSRTRRAARRPRRCRPGSSRATMPTPQLSVASRSGWGTPPARRTTSKIGWRGPGAALERGGQLLGHDPGQVGREPAAGHVRHRVDAGRPGPAPGRPWRRSGSARAAPRRACGPARGRRGRAASRPSARTWRTSE